MDCAQFDEILADIDRRGTRAAELREEALAHAESCGRCGLKLIESESLDFALKSLAARERGRQAPARVEAALVARFRREAGMAGRRKLQWRIAAVGIAAAGLLAAGVSLGWRGQFRTEPDKNAASARATSNVSAPADTSATTPATSNEESGAALAGKVASRTVAKHAAAAEAAGDSASETDFVMLPNADDPSALVNSAVIRVVMPRSALASFGFPVASMASADSVSADLLVSEDGTPEAIRLVEQD